MAAAPGIRILCVDDHPLVRKGIASIVANEPDMRIVAEAGTGEDALVAFRAHQPDVTLMDLRLPDQEGAAATEAIRREFPDARIIALTSYGGDQDIARALEAGVSGYLLKEVAHVELVRAIRTVHAGRRLLPASITERLAEHGFAMALTGRETEVLRLVAEGLGNREIAQYLGTASGTVKMHVQNILLKLNAADRTHAVALAVQRGILRLG
jgi:DNA-binding NarL/FixJ family response regulator